MRPIGGLSLRSESTLLATAQKNLSAVRGIYQPAQNMMSRLVRRSMACLLEFGQNSFRNYWIVLNSY